MCDHELRVVTFLHLLIQEQRLLRRRIPGGTLGTGLLVAEVSSFVQPHVN